MERGEIALATGSSGSSARRRRSALVAAVVASLSPQAFAAGNLLLVGLWSVAVPALGRADARRKAGGELPILEPVPV